VVVMTVAQTNVRNQKIPNQILHHAVLSPKAPNQEVHPGLALRNAPPVPTGERQSKNA
jgi:hypothetical protein